MNPFVVAVAGPIGAGKSTLVRGLAARLPQAAAIYMDDYEQFTRQPLDEVRRWLREGADPNRLPIPGLAEKLAALKSGPDRFLVFETQFGRTHAATACHIDFLVWIDLPLEFAHARKLAQMGAAADVRDPAGAADFLAWITGYEASYADVVEPALRIQRETVRAGADLVVDGVRKPAVLLSQIESAVLAGRR